MKNLRHLIDDYAFAQLHHDVELADAKQEALMLLIENFSDEILTILGNGLPINGERRVRKVLSLDE
jgi:hypothetical protein